MRNPARCVAFAALTAVLTACSSTPAASLSSPAAVTSKASAPTGSPYATPANAQATACAGPAIKGPWPLGVLHVPIGATPWPNNTYIPLSIDGFVEEFYVKSAWTAEEELYTRIGFVCGAIEGWTNPDGTQQEIALARFASPAGADSMFGELGSTFQEQPKPSTFLTDLPDGAVGWVRPTKDTFGNTKAEMAARTGDLVIDVNEYSAAAPDVAAAKALLEKQYHSLIGH